MSLDFECDCCAAPSLKSDLHSLKSKRNWKTKDKRQLIHMAPSKKMYTKISVSLRGHVLSDDVSSRWFGRETNLKNGFFLAKDRKTEYKRAYEGVL